MITPDQMKDHLTRLETVMLGDLRQLWDRESGSDEPDFRSAIVDQYPDLILPYTSLAGDMAATWYDDQAPDLDYRATTAEPPPIEQMRKSASWAVTTDSASLDSAFQLLSGSAQRAVFNGARNTIVDNANREVGARWARHGSFNSCRFCQLLCTRGGVYKSAESAAGKKFHDHCHCIAVMVRPGHTYTPPPYVQGWEDDYRAAVELAGSSGISAVMNAYRRMDSPQ